jgi:phosphotransferase system enzyme I (PtsP)
MTGAGLAHEGSLLLTLEEISQLVSHSHDPAETLANIVQLIQGRFGTDVCSVYLLEAARGELVLGATVGLRPESVGRVRMRTDEGLTGLVVERMAPVTVDDAFEHPRFKYFPDAGEDPYHSFLGVPLVEGGLPQGALVVQTVQPRRFSADETRMLLAVGAQLAPLVSGARLLEQVVAAAHEGQAAAGAAEPDGGPTRLKGVGVSPGVGRGQAYVIDGFTAWQRGAAGRGTGPEGEQRRLARAMEAAREEIARLGQRISALVGEEHGAILQAQSMILQDRAVERDLEECLAVGATAEDALLQTLDRYVAAFQKLSTPYFQERVFDVKDVFRRLLWHLRPRPAADGAAGDRLVLVAHEASVMDLFSVDLDRLAGVAVEKGGPQCHAAILARSLGVPMVGQLPEFLARALPGRRLLVDGSAGVLTFDPPADPEAGEAPALWLAVPPAAEPPRPAGPPDLLPVEANINLLSEVAQAVARRAAGVGLFRSEFLFLARRALPTEEEQVNVYRKLLRALGGRPATVRTFDLRADKLPHGSPLASPAAAQTLFRDQVRAILRAAADGPARLLVPLVTRTEQLDGCLRALDEARAELTREGLTFGDRVPFGVMIESAAAAAMAESWAGQVDFFALGTNDLTASALGSDRADPGDGGEDDSLHPGLLRLIRDVVAGAHRAGRRVTVCGEMAADSEGALALAALEVDGLSVAVNQIGPVRQALAEVTPEALAGLAVQLAGLRTAGAVRQALRPHVRP